MAKIWCCDAILQLPVLADTMGVAGMPHSHVVTMPVKIRCEDTKPPSSETIAKKALDAWGYCYSVKPTKVLSTYEGFVLWDNV
jgi:hypothetical protein